MTAQNKQETLNIWRLVDGRAGHEKQSQALIEGLRQYKEVNIEDIFIKDSAFLQLHAYLRQQPPYKSQYYNKPDIIIGTGHKVHLPMLLLKWKYRAKSVLIMRPSLPASLFDLIIAPEHDYPNSAPNNVYTIPLALAPEIASQPDKNIGVVLLGGTSKHFHWDIQFVNQQIEQLISRSSPNIHWFISNSPRTPEQQLPSMAILREHFSNISLINYREQPKHWLSEILQQAGHIWISTDSASMIAEALNTKADIGLLDLKAKNTQHKFQTTLENLINKRHLTRLQNYQPTLKQALNSHIHASKQLLHIL